MSAEATAPLNPVLVATGAENRSLRRVQRRGRGAKFAEACLRALKRPWTTTSEQDIAAELASGKLTHYDKVAWGQVESAARGDNRSAKWLAERIGEAAPETISEGVVFQVVRLGGGELALKASRPELPAGDDD